MEKTRFGTLEYTLSFSKRETKKNIAKAVKVVQKVKKAAAKVVKRVASTASKVVNALVQSFVFEGAVEFGAGIGAGTKGSKKKYGGAAEISKTVGISISGGKVEQFTETNAGIKLVMPNSEAGAYYSLRHYDNGYGNPMAMPWDVWDDKENIEKDCVLGYKRDEYKVVDTSFIGLDFSGFIGIGGGIKIGFNVPTEAIKKFVYVL